jgi:amylosucrase
LTGALQAIVPPPRGATWVTYVRCHDDIGWTITPEDAGRAGEDAHLHRRFLADFFAGDFPGSFARGARFQLDPLTGEARTSGTTASLAGLEAATDAADVELAVRRILLLYAIAFAHGGVPLIYMGDELGLLNDPAGAASPDNRLMHRPQMDWEAVARRFDPDAVEGRLWAGLQRLIAARRLTRVLHAHASTEPRWTGNEHVFALSRAFAGERLLVVGNFSADPQWVAIAADDDAASVDGRPLQRAGDGVVLAPYQHLWIRG